MGPVKFDDLNKVAKGVLNDDYLKALDGSYEFKAKQKVDSSGSVFTTTVKLQPKGPVFTPGTVALKQPKPFGVAGLVLDKLEYNKDGAIACEVAIGKELHKVDGLSVTLKTDLEKMEKVSKEITFTGIADTQVKLDAKPFDIPSSIVEVTRTQGPAQIGVKAKVGSVQQPDVGLRLALDGGLFGSLVAKNAFKDLEFMAHYKVNSDIEAAINVNRAGDKISGTAGVCVKQNDAVFKVKASDKLNVDCVAIFSLYKGFKVLAGAKYTADKKASFGASLQVE